MLRSMVAVSRAFYAQAVYGSTVMHRNASATRTFALCGASAASQVVRIVWAG